MSIYYKSK